MEARTVKRLVAAAMAIGLSIPLTPAVLSLLSRVFPNGGGRRVLIVPNRGWEIRDRSEGGAIAAGFDGNVDMRESRAFAVAFRLVARSLESTRAKPLWPDVPQSGRIVRVVAADASCTESPTDRVPSDGIEPGKARVPPDAAERACDPEAREVGVAVIDSGIVPMFAVSMRSVLSVDVASGPHPSRADEFGHGLHVAGLLATAAPAVAPVDEGWFAINLPGTTDVGPRLFEVAFTPDAGPTETYRLAAAVSPEPATAAWLRAPSRGVVQVRDLKAYIDTQSAVSITRARGLDLAFALAIVCGWGIGTLVWLLMIPVLYVASLWLVERLPLRIRPMVTTDMSLILRWAHIGLAGSYGLWTIASLWMIGQRLLSVAAG
jgi:hypothetical protein